jgi:hypothetical protein
MKAIGSDVVLIDPQYPPEAKTRRLSRRNDKGRGTEEKMRIFSTYGAFALFLIGLLVTRAEAQDNAPSPGAIPQNVPPAISQNPSIRPLLLSQAQRATIQQALSSEDTEVSFALKAAKSAQNFEPSIGAKIPNALKLHPLPRPLIYRIESLKHYTYVKFKHRILMVDPMTRKIVDMF